MRNSQRQTLIAEAMRLQDRRRFLPPELASAHDRDQPLPIGHGQTNSQPSTVAAMLDLLEPFAGMRVMDVGSGSGWTAAILGQLGGPDSQVVAVERIPTLVERSREAIDLPWVEVHLAEPDVLGLPQLEPFDRILVSAMAEQAPTPLVNQLGDGGILVAPWAGTMHRVAKSGEEIQITAHGAYTFVPLIHARF